MKKKRKTNQARKKTIPKASEKKRNIHISIFAIIAVILLLLIIPQFNNNHSIEQKIKVENMEFREIENKEFLSFDIVNDYSEPVDCTVVFAYSSQTINWNIGEISSNSRKNFVKEVFMPAGETKVKLTAKCQRK